MASSWPAHEHCGPAQEGEKLGNGWGRGNIVFEKEPNVIVMIMTNKSVQEKKIHFSRKDLQLKKLTSHFLLR